MAYNISDVQLRLANRLGESASPSVTTELEKRRTWIVEGIEEILKKRPFWFTQKIFTDKTIANVPYYSYPDKCRKEFMIYVDGYKYEKIDPLDKDTIISPLRVLSVNDTIRRYNSYYRLRDKFYLIPTPSKSSEQKDVVSITASGTTCTVTLTNHGYVTGNYVTISGANQSEYNGKFEITYIDGDTFKYTASSAPSVSPATGTIKATLDNIEIWGYEYPTLPTSESDGIVIPDNYISGLVAYAEARFWSSAHKRGKAADAFAEFESVVDELYKEDARRNFLGGHWKFYEV